MSVEYLRPLDGGQTSPRIECGERQFQRLVNAVREYALYMLDRDGYVASWNTGAARIKGYSANEIIGQHFERFYSPQDRAAGGPAKSLATALEQGRFEAVGQRVRKDGSYFWANVVIDPIYDDDGNHVGFSKVTRDITEQHAQEERLHAEMLRRRQAEHDASQSRERLLDAIEALNDGFALYDPEDRLLLYNRRYRELNPAIADLIVPGARFEDLLLARSSRSRTEKKPMSPQQVAEHFQRHHAADGEPHVDRRAQRWCRSSERRTRDGGIVIIETDISDLKNADEAKDEFLAKISHELRTPITPIQAVLSLISAGKLSEQPAEFDNLLDLAQRNCARLRSIVNDLLDINRINAGSFSLEKQPVRVRALLESVRDDHVAAQKQQSITLNISPEVVAVELHVDPARIGQVLDNLINNAFKFCELGNPVSLDAAMHEGKLRISIIDRGCGVPKDFQASIFEAFTQADTSASRRYGGVGLGLNISKSIVEMHDGAIGFTTSEGKGSIFYVDLPFAKTLNEGAG